MVGEVVADIVAFDITVLGELVEEVFVELLEVVLDFARVDGVAVGVDAGGDHVRALVHVGEENSGAYARLRVETRAPVAVPARADLEVERAVHPVLLRPEYRCQVLRHLSVRVRVSVWVPLSFPLAFRYVYPFYTLDLFVTS